MILYLEAVHEVHLLTNPSTAEMSLRHAGRKLDGLLSRVDWQLAHLAALQRFVRCVDLGLDEPLTFGQHRDPLYVDRRGAHSDAQLCCARRSYLHTIDHD